MAGETNPTRPSPMTDTEAGKRLSDTELAEIAERHKLENVKGSNLWSNWYECNAQREKLLSHIAAITSNRGSVSEDRLAETLYDAFWKRNPRANAPAFSLQAEAIKTMWLQIAADAQQVVAAMGGEGPAFKWREDSDSDALDYLGMKAENLLRALPPSPVAEEVATAFYEHIKHGDEKHRAWLKEECDGKLVELIRALPLPPSPVNPGGAKVLQGLRDAIDGNFARVTIDGQVWERVSPVKESRDAQKPVCGTYHSRAIGVACSNCGHLKEEHQGGEGK